MNITLTPFPDTKPENDQRCLVVQNPNTTATKELLVGVYNSGTEKFSSYGGGTWVDIVAWTAMPQIPSEYFNRIDPKRSQESKGQQRPQEVDGKQGWESWQNAVKTCPFGINPHAYVLGYKAAYKEQEEFFLHLVDVVACFTAEQNQYYQYYDTNVRKQLIEDARKTFTPKG